MLPRLVGRGFDAQWYEVGAYWAFGEGGGEVLGGLNFFDEVRLGGT